MQFLARSQGRSHALGWGWGWGWGGGGGQVGLGPALCLAPPDLQETQSPRAVSRHMQGGPQPRTLPPEPAFSLRCSALSSVSAWGRLRPLPGCPASLPSSPWQRAALPTVPRFLWGLPGWGEQIHSWRSTRPPAPFVLLLFL